MSRINLFILICITSLIYSTTSAQNDLQSGFANPPSSAKARTWWHWIDGNVSKEGITADLEAMKRVGIQEAQIFNVGQGYPEGPATFMTPQWLELFRFAASEAKRVGLEIGFHNGAGWSSSGGPWITPQYAMQTIVFSEAKYKGNKKIKEALSQPASKFGYYKDIIVLAFPTPKSEERIDELELKTLSGHTFKGRMQPNSKQINASALVYKKDIVDLTSRMSADGILEWNVPEGEWTVLRIGHTANGTENRPAGAGGRGLECDKLSRKAMDVYWEGGIKPIIDKLGSLVGSTLTNCLIDSYEVGCNNWTTGLDKEFIQRRGYDCMAFFPTLAGYYVEDGEITERFLWDWRRTIGDLIAENYYGYFSELCHKHGMKFSVEPYGGPFDTLQAGDTGDIVMSEFWVGNTAFLDSPKLVASIAHLNGNSIVGAESFTSMGGWLNHPATLKQIGDWVWSEGVNRFIFHTYVHQPWNIAPGLTFHMYGVEMSRLNTWWEQGRAYMDYIARSQFMLQQGRNAADVLVFIGESSPNDGILRPDIKALGYDYDEIGMSKIGELTVNDGWICTPVGGKYRLLLLPEITWMTPDLLHKINNLVKAGAIVIGQKPNKSPSLSKYPECDKEVSLLASEMWGNNPSDNTKIKKGKVISNRSVQDVFEELALPADFSGGRTGSDLNFIHRITENADIYFVANPRKNSRDEICSFRVTGKQPQFWNPETGEIRDAAVWKEEKDGTTSLPVFFEPEGAVFVVFQKKPLPLHIVQTETNLDIRQLKPLPDLKIIKAEYGTFLPDGLVDVTEILNNQIKNNRLEIWANNNLSSDDPAAGSVKELRVEYEVGGQRHLSQSVENARLLIETEKSGELIILRAVYGKFPELMKGVPQKHPIYDVTDEIKMQIAANNLIMPVDDHLINEMSKHNDQKKELRLTYFAEGEIHQASIPQGRNVSFALSTPEPKLIMENNNVVWKTPYAGKITTVTSYGATKTVQAKSIPKPIELSGAWDVSFSSNLGAPDKATFNELTSWSESSVDGIRYFSGTATYRKQFTISKNLIGEGRSLELDLGSVRVIAEVFINGKNLGILWKAPFRIDISEFIHEGPNELEVHITNLWPNRLIGDDRLSEDFNWGDWTLKSWPDWLVNHTERSSDRVTFTTWKHWNKDSHLQVSGLLGPVYIRPYVHVKVLDISK
ncbi:MAG: glycosyl hydrolase [Dysgonomonas sp.]